MNTPQKIRVALAGMPAGTVFGFSDLLPLGGRAAVDQTLYRWVKAGQIKRVARGLYAAADGLPSTLEVVSKALAQTQGKQVVVTPPDATNGSGRGCTLVLTPGPSRLVVVNGHMVQFRRASGRKIALAQTPQGQVLLGLWDRGQEALTTLDIKQVTGNWPEADLDKFAPLIPAWLRQAIKQSNAQRKSAKLGLSGAYDWSNPQIKDAALIGKVLEKHDFEDVVRVCAHYGVPKVKRVFRQRELGPMTRASVTRMLNNIGVAFKRAEVKAHAKA